MLDYFVNGIPTLNGYLMPNFVYTYMISNWIVCW